MMLLFLQEPVQAPAAAPSVIVGLTDDQEVVVQNPEFSGFIESRPEGSVLLFRQDKFRGEILLSTIERIDFGYQRNQPFPLTVTLRNGQRLEVQANRRDFLTIKGSTDFGTVTINHPDPISAALRITTRWPNREEDLTIRYVQFR
jgi:hypothetical protein